jgi:hypothetical protein
MKILFATSLKNSCSLKKCSSCDLVLLLLFSLISIKDTQLITGELGLIVDPEHISPLSSHQWPRGILITEHLQQPFPKTLRTLP